MAGEAVTASNDREQRLAAIRRRAEHFHPSGVLAVHDLARDALWLLAELERVDEIAELAALSAATGASE